MEDNRPALRMLVVAPRPLLLSRVPDRTDVEAIYEAVEAQGNRMEAEWLWPATYDAFVERLHDAEAPIVDILYLSGVASDDGRRLTLQFEGEGGDASPIGLDALGGTCSDADLSLVMLQAIADAGSMGEAFCEHVSSLAASLALNVLLLSGEMSAQALTTMGTELFAGFLAKEPLGRAVAKAQHACEDGRGGALFAAQEDVVIGSTEGESSSGVSKIIRFPEGGLQPAWQSLPSPSEVGGLPPEPDHPFVGRGREIVELEKAMRKSGDEGPLWICGYEGLGKTTLAAHVARWLVRTGRFEHVVYTNFQGGGLSEWPLHNLGKDLVGDEFSPGRDGSLEAVEEALAKTPTLVLWDNIEAVLPTGTFPLDPEEKASLFQLARRLGEHQECALCILSDTPDVPDAARALEPLCCTLSMNPLNKEDALVLLDTLMETAHERVAPALAELVDVLAGHPLALCVLGSLLKDGDIEQMMTDLEEIMPGIHEGQAHLRNGAVILALEYLMRSFDQDTRYELYSLGLFAGGFVEFLALQMLNIEREMWEQCKERFVSTHLMQPRRLEGINVPFVGLHPALPHHLARRLGSQQRKRLEEKYYGSYLGLLKWLSETDAEYPDAARVLARHEMPNFRRGFQRILEAENLNAAVAYMRYLQYFLNVLDLPAERDAIAEQFQETASKRIPAEGPLDRPAFQFLLGQSERLLQSGRVSQAGSLLQQLVQRISEEDGLSYGGDEAALDRAVALHRFGQLLQNARQFEGAHGAFQKALGSLEGIEGNETVRSERLVLYQALAQVLVRTGRPQEAEEACQSGLEIAQELDNREAMGALNVQLANIALTEEYPEKARANLETALIHFKAVDDELNMARTWSRLGGIARQEPDMDEAQHCYEQALELTRGTEHAAYAAQMLGRLAQLAEVRDDVQRAEVHYREAIQIYAERGQKMPLVAAQMELAEFLLRQEKLEVAHEWAEAARAVAEDLGTRFNPWKIYVLLQRIAEAQGDREAEAQWRGRAREAFVRSSQAESVRRRWRGLIDAVAKSARGEALDAQAVETIEELETNEEWQQLAGAIWRILGGERGDAIYEELDHVDGTIVQSVLHAIEHPPGADEGE
ncbi:MAG: tetratricopeptide repeat protein [Anaerolineales bacterium]